MNEPIKITILSDSIIINEDELPKDYELRTKFCTDINECEVYRMENKKGEIHYKICGKPEELYEVLVYWANNFDLLVV